MSIVSWILLGLVVGLIANALDPKPASGGIIGAILLGIVGAIVGGFLGQVVLGTGITGFNLGSIVIALIGSLIVLFLARSFNKA
ncbi:MAG TPA: GlsB/YeaQ/YmgE family stress response membrane protein [Candidatus Saccharimonadales bacterium]|nr:GlsB/YeaQ/YmgE family stress response membrane protein [Candidatus Saccharimonadales bacterium]